MFGAKTQTTKFISKDKFISSNHSRSAYPITFSLIPRLLSGPTAAVIPRTTAIARPKGDKLTHPLLRIKTIVIVIAIIIIVILIIILTRRAAESERSPV